MHLAKYNVARKNEKAGLCSDLCICPLPLFSAQARLFPVLVPKLLTIMEPTTGPLITHHRAVLSFISQQLKDRQKEERLSSGLGCQQVNCPGPRGAFLLQLSEEELAGKFSGMLQTQASFWFF